MTRQLSRQASAAQQECYCEALQVGMNGSRSDREAPVCTMNFLQKRVYDCVLDSVRTIGVDQMEAHDPCFASGREWRLPAGRSETGAKPVSCTPDSSLVQTGHQPCHCEHPLKTSFSVFTLHLRLKRIRLCHPPALFTPGPYLHHATFTTRHPSPVHPF